MNSSLEKRFKKLGNPYLTLGISPSSSKKEIKKAHLRLAKILHPDKETGNEEKFIKIQQAYEVLRDEEIR